MLHQLFVVAAQGFGNGVAEQLHQELLHQAGKSAMGLHSERAAHTGPGVVLNLGFYDFYKFQVFFLF